MEWFRGLNARILAYINQRSGSVRLKSITWVDSHLLLSFADGSSHKRNWLSVRRVVGWLRDVYAGTMVCLALEFADGEVIEIPESCPGWPSLCDAVERLPGAIPVAEWYLQVQSTGAGQAIDIWHSGVSQATGLTG